MLYSLGSFGQCHTRNRSLPICEFSRITAGSGNGGKSQISPTEVKSRVRVRDASEQPAHGKRRDERGNRHPHFSCGVLFCLRLPVRLPGGSIRICFHLAFIFI